MIVITITSQDFNTTSNQTSEPSPSWQCLLYDGGPKLVPHIRGGDELKLYFNHATGVHQTVKSSVNQTKQLSCLGADSFDMW